MYKKILLVIVAMMMCATFISMGGCTQTTQVADGLVDGYYSAEMSEYSNGWKEFVTICVNGGEIVSVEYNAKNESGFIKSWDMAYMRKMNANMGTYPNAYTRNYAAQLIELQGAEGIDTVTGATTSGSNFTKMAVALLEQASAGDKTLCIVSTK